MNKNQQPFLRLHPPHVDPQLADDVYQALETKLKEYGLYGPNPKIASAAQTLYSTFLDSKPNDKPNDNRRHRPCDSTYSRAYFNTLNSRDTHDTHDTPAILEHFVLVVVNPKPTRDEQLKFRYHTNETIRFLKTQTTIKDCLLTHDLETMAFNTTKNNYLKLFVVVLGEESANCVGTLYHELGHAFYYSKRQYLTKTFETIRYMHYLSKLVEFGLPILIHGIFYYIISHLFNNGNVNGQLNVLKIMKWISILIITLVCGMYEYEMYTFYSNQPLFNYTSLGREWDADMFAVNALGHFRYYNELVRYTNVWMKKHHRDLHWIKKYPKKHKSTPIANATDHKQVVDEYPRLAEFAKVRFPAINLNHLNAVTHPYAIDRAQVLLQALLYLVGPNDLFRIPGLLKPMERKFQRLLKTTFPAIYAIQDKLTLTKIKINHRRRRQRAIKSTTSIKSLVSKWWKRFLLKCLFALNNYTFDIIADLF